MNLFGMASRGVDLDALPEDDAPRSLIDFGPSAAPAGRMAVPQEFDSLFDAAASEYGVDPTILKGIAYAESRFRPDVIDGTTKSSAGALGLMQFMPATAKEMGINPLDPAEAVFGAAAYLRQSLDKFGGDTERAIASYNWGRNRSAFDRDDWYTSLPAETRNYVGTVLEFADNVAPVAAPAGGKAVPLPEGVAPSLAGGGRGVVNPELGVNNFQEQKATKRDELAPLDEAARGVKTGITGLKQMWESNAVLKDATLAANMQERLNAFDQIDQGATNVPRAIGLAYQQAGPEERQRLRGVVQKELGNRREFLDASLATIKQYQADMQRTKGRVAEFTDIEGVKDFTNWLAFNGGSGMASMAPLIVAAVTTGPLAPVAAGVVGYGMATGELNNDRIEYAQKQGLDNRGVADYVADKRGSTLGAAIPFAGLDVVAGPVGSVVKTATKGGIKELQRMGVKQGLKEIGKDTAEEAVTGGLQEMIKLGTGYGLDETQELLTKENAKKVLNSAAAEAAGGLTGGAARVTGTAAVQQMQAPRVQDQPTTPQAPVVAAVPAEVPQAPVAAPVALAETQPAPASANWSDVATAQKQAQAEQAVMAKAEALPTATRPSDPASTQAVSNIEALLGPVAQPTATPAAPAAPATEQAAPTVEQAEQQLAAREAAQTAPVDMQMRSTGTLMVKGDPVALRARLTPAGVDNTIAVPGGLIVARSQAVKAQEVLSAPAQAPAAPTAAVTPQQEAANVPQGQTPPAQPAAQAASTTAPAVTAVDAGVPAAGVPAAGGAATAQADGVKPKPEAPIVKFRREAASIESGLPPVAEGMTRMWRGNRPGEIGQNPVFTNDLPGIALPFRDAYQGELSYVDVPTAEIAGYTNSNGVAKDAEFTLPRQYAAQAIQVARGTATQPEGATAPQAAPEATTPAADPFAEKMRANMALMDQRRQLRQEIAAAPEGQRAALEARMAELETQIQSGVAEARGITRATDTQPEPAATRTTAPAESAAPRTQARTPPARPAPTTAGFKRWFAGSKVVDDKGAPLVMYHGTSGNERGDAFTTIDTYASNYGLMGQGGYFTADPSVASSYTTKGKGSTPTVYPVYLSIKNPIDMDAKADPIQWQEQFPDAESFHEGGETNESWYRAAEDSLRDQALPMWEGAEIMQDGLRAMGYDGITHVGGGRVAADGVRHRVYIAFDPEQAKSATGNNGQFDPANPDIRYSRGISPEVGAELESIKPPRRVKEVFATKESVNTALAKLVPASGRLPNGLGKIVVANAAEIRDHWEPLIGPVELASESSGRVQGFYAQRTVFLIADHIRAGDEMAVAAHELMHKHGQAVLGAAGWDKLHSTIERWANAPEGSTERLVYDEAVARVEASRPGDISIPEYTTQELFPYAVQIALEMGIQPSVTKPLGTVAGWLAHVRGVLSRTWAKMTEKPELFDSLDLLDMAFAIAQRENPDAATSLDRAAEGQGSAVAPSALEEFSKADDLFALPKSDKTTIEEIIAEHDPDIQVRTTSFPGNETMYTLNMPQGQGVARITVRASTDSSVYDARDMGDGEYSWETGRPGENPDDVPAGTEDVWIDVSKLKPGKRGDMVYNIAATFAHNTGRIFIGDPNGLTAEALRRRLEHMISSALKFGTTEHLAPHPNQVRGGNGVPPLRWVYGDHEGNVERMIAASVQALDNAYPDSRNIAYDPARGFYRTDTGDTLSRGQLADGLRQSIAERRAGPGGDASTGQGGWRTVARAALFRYFQGAIENGAGPDRGRLLDRIGQDVAGLQRRGAADGTGSAYPREERIFYSRDGAVTPEKKESALQWRDASGRVQFAPGDWLYNKLGAAAAPMLTALGLKSASPELRRQLRQMKLQVQRAQELSAKVATEAAKLSAEDRAMVSDLVEKDMQAGTVPPEHAVKLAALISATMDKQSAELVELGMLSKEGAERWQGTYLPRFYESKLSKKVGDAWADAMRRLVGRPRLMKGIGGKHLKGRGMFETIDPASLENYQALGWEVRDPDYVPGTSTEVQVWRDFNREERQKMGEIRDAGFRFVMGYMQTQKDIALGRMFQNLATDDRLSSRLATKEMDVRVPDTKVEGTGANVYGKLAGRYVSKETLSHLSSFDEVHNDTLQLYRQAMSLWKEGKALALDTPIPTPAGWTTMGALDVGDTVFDEHGAPCKVTFVTGVQLDRECYEVEFSDGTKIVADAEHLWFTIYHGKGSVKNTKRILETLKERTRGDNNHSIPVAGALKTPDAVLPIPPYALGAWLGDGRTSSAVICAGAQDADEMAENLRASGLAVGAYQIDKRNGVVSFGIRYPDASLKRSAGLQPTMRSMGLLGNKHIPAAYLRASEAQRRDLLCGLMDTDGHITEAGKCEFSTTSPQIRDGMMELLRSLGYKPACGTYTARINGRDCGDSWRIKFQAYADRPVFKMERKAARLRECPETRQRSGTRQIVAIRLVDSVPVKCITVDSESRLYLAGDGMVPTHNTVLNPVAHMNNVVSNMTMAHLAGISYHRGDKYIGALADFIKGAPMIEDAKDAGLFLGNFSQSELMEQMPEDLKKLVNLQEGIGAKTTKTAMAVMTMLMRKPMGKAYEFEDSFFKYMLYKDARQRGLEQQDAIDYAQRYIFTYDDLPKGARRIRDYGIPFFAYTYKAVPALLHTAMAHPVRMATPAALLWATTALTYAAMADGDDDTPWDELVKKYLTDADFRKKAAEAKEFDQKHMPTWMRGNTAFFTPKTMRVGYDKVMDLPVFLDISRFIPGGDLFDVTPNAGGVPLPQPITPNHPLLTMAMGMLGNKDMFTGKELVDKNDTKGEAAEKRAAWIYRQVAPAIAVGQYHWNRGMEMVAQASGGEITWLPEFISERYTGIGSDGLPVLPEYGIPQTFGIKVRPMDQDKAAAIERAIDKKLIQSIDADIRQLARQNRNGTLSDQSFEKQREYQREKRARLKDGLTVDGAEKE